MAGITEGELTGLRHRADKCLSRHWRIPICNEHTCRQRQLHRQCKGCSKEIQTYKRGQERGGGQQSAVGVEGAVCWCLCCL